jgi:biopolymer transport protein ExbB
MPRGAPTLGKDTRMLEIVRTGGWVMWPLLLCSILALGIALERAWTLRESRVIPDHLVAQVWQLLKANDLGEEKLAAVRASSPLGRVLAAGLALREAPRDVMKERIEDIGRHVSHDLERNLNALGTIAAIAPFLGLLGTVSGLIRVFSSIDAEGLGNPAALAGGISEALITTFAGLALAIPALVAYRHFRGRVLELVLRIEEEVMRLMDALHSSRGGKRA